MSPLFASLLWSANRLSLSVSSSDHVPCCPPGATFPVAALNVDKVPDGGAETVVVAVVVVVVVVVGAADTGVGAGGAVTG